MVKLKKLLCLWCEEVFESKFGAYCSFCRRFPTNTANPNLPEPLNKKVKRLFLYRHAVFLKVFSMD